MGLICTYSQQPNGIAIRDTGISIKLLAKLLEGAYSVQKKASTMPMPVTHVSCNGLPQLRDLRCVGPRPPSALRWLWHHHTAHLRGAPDPGATQTGNPQWYLNAVNREQKPCS